MPKYKYIIWDWNGTILDDLMLNLEVENTLLSRRGRKLISGIEEYHEKFQFPIIKFYEELDFDFENEKFEDYYLEFDSVGEKNNSYFSDDGLTLPYTKPYPMIDGKIIELKHSLFDNDAIFLDDENDAVTLKNKCNPYSVRVEFKDMTKIGFWQDEHTTAPFLCIEPWHGIPADDGVMDDLSTKKQMIHLEPNKEYSSYFKIIIQE